MGGREAESEFMPSKMVTSYCREHIHDKMADQTAKADQSLTYFCLKTPKG